MYFLLNGIVNGDTTLYLSTLTLEQWGIIRGYNYMFGFPSTRHNHLYLLLMIVYQLNELILECKKGTLLKAKLTST